MKALVSFLKNSYTPYQAVENAEVYLQSQGFSCLPENEAWKLKRGGKYYTVRGGSALIAFVFGDGDAFRIIASHTDSPCLKLKENAALSDGAYTRLNCEPYGGGLAYTFFDRPLKIAGRAVYETERGLTAKNFVSNFQVVVPSLAIHMNRKANSEFAPNLQTDLPLLAVGKADLAELTGSPLSSDLYAVCAEEPFESGAQGELLSSPRIDNLTSVYSSLHALAEGKTCGVCVAACLDGEEVGSRTQQGAGSDFLAAVLKRISLAAGQTEEEYCRALSASMLLSMDNAHALHPNHPDKCDPTNKPVLGGGVVIKGHAGNAYTTNALSSAIVKKIFSGSGVKFQTFFNRSDMASGSTLGAISLSKVSVLSADLGIAQLAMHSAVETVAKADCEEAVKGLTAFYESKFRIAGNSVEFD